MHYSHYSVRSVSILALGIWPQPRVKCITSSPWCSRPLLPPPSSMSHNTLSLSLCVSCSCRKVVRCHFRIRETPPPSVSFGLIHCLISNIQHRVWRRDIPWLIIFVITDRGRGVTPHPWPPWNPHQISGLLDTILIKRYISPLDKRCFTMLHKGLSSC